MNIRLHRNATTTPRIRRQIQQSNESVVELARRYGVTAPTVLVNKTGHINLLNSHTHSATNHYSTSEADQGCNT